MNRKNWLFLVIAVIAVTGAGIGIMLAEIRQGDLPADANVPVTD